MNSASILMNLAPAAPAAPATAGVEETASPATGFGQALCAAQVQAGVDAQVQDAASSPPVVDPAVTDPLQLASSLLVRGLVPGTPDGQGTAGLEQAPDDDSIEVDDSAAAVDSGAASVLAQMLAGATPLAAAVPPTPDAAMQVTPQVLVPAAKAAKPSGEAQRDAAQASVDGSEPAVSGTASEAESPANPAPSAMDAAALTLAEKSFELPPTGGQQSQSPLQAGSTAQAVVHAAVSALRDAAPAVAAAPAHATLREPVGTARWADELGNHLVLMSVRGQQQGSLVLTPEHLGPVEVQISVNRDTANVWFGAQHADTRSALAEAMPRLRELLASSGLSLGQSGVSEQAPRGNPTPATSLADGGARGVDVAPVAEDSVPAWRVWRPGLLDTYA